MSSRNSLPRPPAPTNPTTMVVLMTTSHRYSRYVRSCGSACGNDGVEEHLGRARAGCLQGAGGPWVQVLHDLGRQLAYDAVVVQAQGYRAGYDAGREEEDHDHRHQQLRYAAGDDEEAADDVVENTPERMPGRRRVVRAEPTRRRQEGEHDPGAGECDGQNAHRQRPVGERGGFHPLAPRQERGRALGASPGEVADESRGGAPAVRRHKIAEAAVVVREYVRPRRRGQHDEDGRRQRQRAGPASRAARRGPCWTAHVVIDLRTHELHASTRVTRPMIA